MQKVTPPPPTLLTRAVAYVWGFYWPLPIARDVRHDVNPFMPFWMRTPFENVKTTEVSA